MGLTNSQIDTFRVRSWKRGVGEHIVQSQRYATVPTAVYNATVKSDRLGDNAGGNPDSATQRIVTNLIGASPSKQTSDVRRPSQIEAIP